MSDGNQKTRMSASHAPNLYFSALIRESFTKHLISILSLKIFETIFTEIIFNRIYIQSLHQLAPYLAAFKSLTLRCICNVKRSLTKPQALFLGLVGKSEALWYIWMTVKKRLVVESIDGLHIFVRNCSCHLVSLLQEIRESILSQRLTCVIKTSLSCKSQPSYTFRHEI